MAESNLQRCLDDVVEFIRALPVDLDQCRDLSQCREVVTRSVQEAAPAFVQKWPVLFSLLAASSIKPVIGFLIDLAIKAKCPLVYLSVDEQNQLVDAGLSSREQILLGRLRERLTNDDTLS